MVFINHGRFVFIFMMQDKYTLNPPVDGQTIDRVLLVTVHQLFAALVSPIILVSFSKLPFQTETSNKWFIFLCYVNWCILLFFFFVFCLL